MRIGIDARFITNIPRRGIGVYSKHLVNSLIKLFPEFTFFLYVYNPDIEFDLPNGINVIVRRIPIPSYVIWEQVGLPYFSFIDKIDVLHCLGNTAPIFLIGNTKLVVTLHDVIFMHRSEYFPLPLTLYQRLGRIYRKIVCPIAVSKAKVVITDSDHSKNDILKYITSINQNKINVVHIGCDPAFCDQSRNMIKNTHSMPFILCLGAEDPRKNTVQVVKAFITLINKLPKDNNINLLIVGYKNWKQSEAYKLVNSSGLVSRIHFFSFVSDEELAMLYKSAFFFIYPSYYEGFGLPLLEAFNSGCPVIASNSSCLPEIGGDAPIYFNPSNSRELYQAIIMVLNDEALRRSMRTKGFKRAINFDWNLVASKTMKLYLESFK